MAAISSTVLISSSTPPKTIFTASARFFSSTVIKASRCSLLHGFHTLSPPLSTYISSSCHLSLKAASSSSSVGSVEYAEEPATKVKFQTTLSLPGCSTALSLLGTGYREKVFAIVGVKVYAAGFYSDQAIYAKLESWKGRSAAELQQDSSLFDTMFQAPLEKALQIVLVRDVDGKTFWDALDEAVSPRIKSRTPVDDSALSTFSSVFQGRPLKKGTFIFLTWLNPVKMIVSVSSDGIPSAVDATIESGNVAAALFDVFLGTSTVSPSLKSSVAKELAANIK